MVPVAYQRRHIEWKSRDSGGGFVRAFAKGEELPTTTPDERGKDITEAGNQLTPTAEHYVLLVKDDGTYEQCVLTMSSTQLKHSRKWNSMVSMKKMQGANGTFTPPRYSHYYRLDTFEESNDQGAWMSWPISDDGVLDSEELPPPKVLAKQCSLEVPRPNTLRTTKYLSKHPCD